jgi:4-nitrophenyl phosphatase
LILIQIGAVIVGNDVQFTYAKLAYGLRALNARTDCILLATNTDHSMPLPGGPLPGAGAVVAAISTASQRQPLVAGKPEQLLMDIAVQRCRLNRSRTLMVGDKLDTDILFGQRGGMRTALVLSGVTSSSEISVSDIRPDFVLNSIAELI